MNTPPPTAEAAEAAAAGLGGWPAWLFEPKAKTPPEGAEEDLPKPPGACPKVGAGSLLFDAPKLKTGSLAGAPDPNPKELACVDAGVCPKLNPCDDELDELVGLGFCCPKAKMFEDPSDFPNVDEEDEEVDVANPPPKALCVDVRSGLVGSFPKEKAADDFDTAVDAVEDPAPKTNNPEGFSGLGAGGLGSNPPKVDFGVSAAAEEVPKLKIPDGSDFLAEGVPKLMPEGLSATAAAGPELVVKLNEAFGGSAALLGCSVFPKENDGAIDCVDVGIADGVANSVTDDVTDGVAGVAVDVVGPDPPLLTGAVSFLPN